MATHFQIKKGLSTELFDIQGNCRLKTKVEGCWYLTLDTAEVYVCVRSNPSDASSELVLKRINELGDFADYYKKAEIDSFLAEIETELESIRSNINIIEANVESNTKAIATIVECVDDINGQLVTVNNTLDKHEASIETLTQTVEQLETTNTETLATITTEISTLKETAENLTEVVETKANKTEVYTRAEVYTKEEALAEVDKRINALIVASDPEGDGNVIENIQTLVEYVENNAGDIASIIETNTANTEKLVAVESKLDNVESQLADIESSISSVEGKLAGVETTVTEYVEEYVTEQLDTISTDKLVQGEDTLILDGGAAPVVNGEAVKSDEQE